MKTIQTILLTFTVTATVIAFAMWLFLGSILGVFGMATASVATLAKLETSQQIVEKMRGRHDARKLKISDEFAEKTGKRVASTALAAATVGTAAVAVAMFRIEIDDYCDEKRELQKEGDLLYGTETAFNADKCFEEAREDSKAVVKEAMDAAPKVVSDALAASAEYGTEAWAAVKDSSVRALQSGSEEANRLWESASSWLTK